MRDRPDAVMLFAAGFGTRMGRLTADCPKPLIPVAGRPLIDHALDQVHGYRPARIVANLHYRPEQISAHLRGSGILFSVETPDILETGGGLRAALPLLGEGPVLTMNTDAVWMGPNPLDRLAQHWDPDRMDALLLCIAPDRATGHTGSGDFRIADDGRATRGPGAVYSGAQIVKTDCLHLMPEGAFSLNILWDQMITGGRLFGIFYPGQWCDVGTPQGIARAEAMLGAKDV